MEALAMIMAQGITVHVHHIAMVVIARVVIQLVLQFVINIHTFSI